MDQNNRGAPVVLVVLGLGTAVGEGRRVVRVVEGDAPVLKGKQLLEVFEDLTEGFFRHDRRAFHGYGAATWNDLAPCVGLWKEVVVGGRLRKKGRRPRFQRNDAGELAIVLADVVGLVKDGYNSDEIGDRTLENAKAAGATEELAKVFQFATVTLAIQTRDLLRKDSQSTK